MAYLLNNVNILVLLRTLLHDFGIKLAQFSKTLYNKARQSFYNGPRHMTKKIFGTFSILLLCTILLTGCGGTTNNKTTETNQPTQSSVSSIPAGRFYFSSPSCIHCQTVAKYVQEHDIHSKMYYIDQTVGVNAPANDLLKAVAARCSISDTELSIPLFWDGTACHMGSDSVIEYFSSNTK